MTVKILSNPKMKRKADELKLFRRKIKELDRLFGLHIRNHFAIDGICYCYTCGKPFFKHDMKRLNCGHYHSRSYYSIRWNINNARPQCVACNCWGHGKQEKFGEKLLHELGDNLFYSLLAGRNKHKPTIFKLDYLINDYKNKLEEQSHG